MEEIENADRSGVEEKNSNSFVFLFDCIEDDSIQNSTVIISLLTLNISHHQ